MSDRHLIVAAVTAAVAVAIIALNTLLRRICVLAVLGAAWSATGDTAAAQKSAEAEAATPYFRYCVHSNSLRCPPVEAPLQDVAMLDGPCWGWFGSKEKAERFVRALPRECGFHSRLVPVPKKMTYVFEGHRYELDDQIILVDFSHSFSRSRPIERDALVVLAQMCFDGASYVGPGIVLDAPSGKVYAFDSVWGVARKDAHRLYLSQSFRVADTNLFHEGAVEYLKAVKSGLGKQFGVDPEEIQLFSYGDYNRDWEGDPVVMGYLTVLDLRTGKIREIPRLGVAEIWPVGDTVFGSVPPSHCMPGDLGQWVVLSNDPLEWRELTPKQLARATEGLKALNERTAFGTAEAPGVAIGATRDRSMVLFVTEAYAVETWTVLQVGRRIPAQAQKK